ncbi:hypothetical protein STIAU_3339 [Stigmatella aurantiaca DW4/3-1]|uniref:Uncharacterized protein n=1 Tax=Stigmatella aurantiaca (strain DW4/3-1) TaxID=378806 RepID=Q099L0_STIAD|nr:hypothetical protein STIAU_3339 [Stigmatella aurantiaca DW4/3-1]
MRRVTSLRGNLRGAAAGLRRARHGQPLDELLGQRAVLGVVHALGEQLAGHFHGQVHRHRAHLGDGLELLVFNLAPGLDLELLGLLAALVHQLVAVLLHVLLVLAHHLRGLAAGLGDGRLLVGQELLRLGALALGALDGAGDLLLALLHQRQDGSPRLPPQHHGHEDEGDEGPEDEARADLHEAAGGEDGRQEHGGVSGDGGGEAGRNFRVQRSAGTAGPAPPRGRRTGPGRKPLGLGGQQDADHEREQRGAFDERRGDDHRGADVATGGRLTAGRVHGGGGQLTDAETGTDDGEAGTDTSGQEGKSEVGHGSASSFFFRDPLVGGSLCPFGATSGGLASSGYGWEPPEGAPSTRQASGVGPAMVVAGAALLVAVAVLAVRVMVVAHGHAHADEQRGEHGEDVGLHEGHEQLQQVDAHGEGHADQRHRGVAEHEDEAQQEEQDDVAGQHVGEQTHREGEGLGEQAQDFHRNHDGPQPRGHAARQVAQVAAQARGADAGHLREDEGADRQARGDGQVPRGGGHPGHQAQHVHEEDEEERGEQVGHVPRALLLADVLDGQLVPDEDDEHLEHVGAHPARHQLALVPVAEAQDEEDEQRRGQPHHHRVLGDGQVQAACAQPRHHLAVVRAHLRAGPLVEGDENLGQVDGLVFVAEGNLELVLVGVRHVVEDVAGHVLLVLALRRGIRGERGARDQTGEQNHCLAHHSPPLDAFFEAANT